MHKGTLTYNSCSGRRRLGVLVVNLSGYIALSLSFSLTKKKKKGRAKKNIQSFIHPGFAPV
jgi:fluoride ion exporter CrcB/FEX